jgi:hypothetical protein
MSDYWWERGWLVVLMAMIVTSVVVIVYGIDSVREWQSAVKHVELSTGCEYVGSPKGARHVGFFDCNGVIETKRIK